MRVHEGKVNLTRGLYRVAHDFFRDFVERHAPRFIVGQIEQLLQMPRDSFAFPVGVGSEIDRIGVSGGLLQVPDKLLFALDGFIDGFKILFHVHAQFALGQVAQVSHTGPDFILFS